MSAFSKVSWSLKELLSQPSEHHWCLEFYYSRGSKIIFHPDFLFLLWTIFSCLLYWFFLFCEFLNVIRFQGFFPLCSHNRCLQLCLLIIITHWIFCKKLRPPSWPIESHSLGMRHRHLYLWKITRDCDTQLGLSAFIIYSRSEYFPHYWGSNCHLHADDSKIYISVHDLSSQHQINMSNCL